MSSVNADATRSLLFSAAPGAVLNPRNRIALGGYGFGFVWDRPESFGFRMSIAWPTYGKFLNDHGQVGERLYVVGWARRGPSGTIGTNRPDGYEVAEQITAALPPGSDGGKEGGAALDRLLCERDVQATTYAHWRQIEAAEVAAARPGSPREKFVRHGDWLKVIAEGA